MKIIQKTGLVIFLIGLAIFTAVPLLGTFKLNQSSFDSIVTDKKIKSEVFISEITNNVVGKEFSGMQALSPVVAKALDNANETHIKNKEYAKKIYTSASDMAALIGKKSGTGFIANNKGIMWFLTFGLAIIGALMYILPNAILLGAKGIKNDGVYHDSATNKGWIAWMVFIFLVSFYLVLYFASEYAVNWTFLVDPISESLSGNPAGHWFVYGFMYCVVMSVMAARMYIKYRHNVYQMVRTTSVLFFQIVFAFLIPEIMVRLQMPYYDFKNAFPLDYDFFFQWNLKELLNSGGIGLFILVWGIVLTLVFVPVMVYFFGKRWYCSWVCGCGGLAETLGDPYRQHSSKSLFSWKVERWLIHGVLLFALVMTALTLYSFFAETSTVFGIKTSGIQNLYSLLIGSIFAGVIGTGFYPIFGNRVWCRFGCPLAAYLGFVQRFKSRFRITTNGGQCISCGNCSTYCEQGIDVRAYAQKGENIVRSSCVGCGVCSAVCPRGVLKLENGPEEGRINPTEVLLGNDVDLMDLVNKK
ncbi:4Fe-4S ferredoxin iron-sulfur binding domain-containing protein [Cellulophaga algicola DSM 14237]|uniref:4Fe-4S ferredoxin iron-sulfur binding domain-containing protein n=1 Tax=Cellulophaga algicola (strain DSM 14237 / IC166 / ACAM 630) TaxID=688270 RepID=E6X4H4_CELAD|nr:4Fe-4S dicluster domain-containing protein [Cellulophaga algicola]ADV48274.1 4Fe-4S ferredoxin iron-sulfur binding domain-containing protein [Cellulophaga algicola DSM 14237]